MNGVLLVHAHPDDECFATAGLIARTVAEGRRVDLVTCTGGVSCRSQDDTQPGLRPRELEGMSEVRHGVDGCQPGAYEIGLVSGR